MKKTGMHKLRILFVDNNMLKRLHRTIVKIKYQVLN